MTSSPPMDLQEVAEQRKRARPTPSLKGRALRFLARREHSRAELRKKLLVEDVSAAEVDTVLDELEAKRFLSDRRYAEVIAHARGARYGVASLARTLSMQGVDREVAAEALAPLRANERDRALEIWKRRFGAPPVSLKERARQHRFLMGRGFDPATVGWVLKQAGSFQSES